MYDDVFCVFRGDDWTLLKTQEELDSANLTLGEHLKKKAESGVRVLIMIWGETTSIMNTHDTETEKYFKGNISTFKLENSKQLNLKCQAIKK